MYKGALKSYEIAYYVGYYGGASLIALICQICIYSMYRDIKEVWRVLNEYFCRERS